MSKSEKLSEADRFFLMQKRKDNTPSTNFFVWIMVLGVIFTYLCRNVEVVQDVTNQVASIKIDMPVAKNHNYDAHPDFSKYPNNDPVCGGEFWCFLGHKL